MPIKLVINNKTTKFISTKYIRKQMETHIIYIITDSNRACLEVEYCTDMPVRLAEISSTSTTLFSGSPKLSNVVYMKTFESKEKALSYYDMLRNFTRMQREKLIRLSNPNWLNLQFADIQKTSYHRCHATIVKPTAIWGGSSYAGHEL